MSAQHPNSSRSPIEEPPLTEFPIAPSASNACPTPRPALLWAISFILIALVYVAFGQSAEYSFLNWDDIIYIRDYPEVKKGLSWEGFVWAWTHPHYSNWHPLTTLSFMFDSTVFGSKAEGFHQHNLVLHALTAVILFQALRHLTGSVWRSAFATAIFAIHPLRVESVAWITERKDVLSGLFLMSTVWAYARYAKSPSRTRYLCVCFLFICGLLSKSVLVTVPGLLLLLDIWPLQRLNLDNANHTPLLQRVWPLLKEKIPLMLFSAGSCVATILSVDLHRPMSPPPLFERLAYIPVWCMSYVRLFLFPFDLAAHYPYVQAGPQPSLALSCLLITITISIVCWHLRKQLPLLLVTWAWFLIALLPVIGIVPPGIQIMADRYTYVAQLLFGVAITWGGAQWTASWKNKWIAPLLASCFVAFLCFFSIRQTRYWGNDEDLWSRTLEVTRENDFANGQLGDSLAVNGRLNEAEPYYREALKLNPKLTGILNNLAVVLRTRGNLAEAEELLRKALQISPWFASAKSDLVNLLLAQSKFDEAKITLEEILKADPHNFEALNRLGIILSESEPKKANYPEAIRLLTEATKLQPDNAGVYFTLGNAHFLAGNIQEAIVHLQTAIQKDPKHAKAANNLGTILSRNNRNADSATAYRYAIQADPNYIEPYDGLAELLLRMKDPEEAVRTWKAALQQNPNDLRAYFKLAWTLSTYPEARIRNGKEAEAIARRGIEINQGKEGLLFDALGTALAEQGLFEAARQSAQKALELVSASNNTAAADAIRNRLELYRDQQPFHQPGR
ncbi:MAG: tetratricopeptide repeat protein [Verrucomicrobiota bacterium]